MIFSGAFDCFGVNRSCLYAIYDQALKQVAEVKKRTSLGQMSLFGDDEIVNIKYPDLEEYDNFQKLKKEKEIIGIYISGHATSIAQGANIFPCRARLRYLDSGSGTNLLLAHQLSTDRARSTLA